MRYFFQFFKKVAGSIAFIGIVASLFVFARTVNDIIVFKEMHPTRSTVLLLIVYIIMAIVFASIYMKLWTGEWHLWSKKKNQIK